MDDVVVSNRETTELRLTVLFLNDLRVLRESAVAPAPGKVGDALERPELGSEREDRPLSGGSAAEGRVDEAEEVEEDEREGGRGASRGEDDGEAIGESVRTRRSEAPVVLSLWCL